MASLNKIPRRPTTHEGASVPKAPTAYEQLRRSICACLLFEDNFYESGQAMAERIIQTAHQVPVVDVLTLAAEVRLQLHLRHAALWLVKAALTHPGRAAVSRALWVKAIEAVCQRPDDMTELVAMYWAGGKRSLPAALKAGFRSIFGRFSPYQLAKYANRGRVHLRDILALVHPVPRDDAQAATWGQLRKDELTAPDTWEVVLSSGADKAETFRRLLAEGKLGGLATLRNLRNMAQVGIRANEVAATLLAQAGKSGIFPYQYLAAARAVPQWEHVIEPAMLAALEGAPKLAGHTVLLVDTSGSMNDRLSAKSELRRIDAAAGLAMLLREVCEDVAIFAFDNHVVAVPPRRGFALRDVLGRAGGGTDTRQAVLLANQQKADRIIVITDEQSATAIPAPAARFGYVMNVAAYQNGIGYGSWIHVSGFSEHLVRYIVQAEQDVLR
jgi:hypothetical protein